jgi:molybdopterin-guanine dinucleotide biosynthesis protein MobB
MFIFAGSAAAIVRAENNTSAMSEARDMAQMVRCDCMHVAAVTGMSGSGKTTLLEALIRLYTGRGARVAAIKHTHHPLNLENRGDTARLLAAGATPVILARDGEAVIWRAAALPPLPVILAGRNEASAALRIDELLEHVRSVDIVLLEGFKEYGEWPRIELLRDVRQSAHEAAAMLDRIWRSS